VLTNGHQDARGEFEVARGRTICSPTASLSSRVCRGVLFHDRLKEGSYIGTRSRPHLSVGLPRYSRGTEGRRAHARALALLLI